MNSFAAVEPEPSYWMIKLYPFALLAISLAANAAFGIDPVNAALPSNTLICLASLAAGGLLVNHSWIMTVTELTRNRYQIFASPEERLAADGRKGDATDVGHMEVDRCLNTHRNTTENTVYFVFLAGLFLLASPSAPAAASWLLLFPVARLGYTYSYFKGSDNLRGVFMSLGLLSLYGMASYLVVASLVA